jgi:hypothetical protein
MNDVTLSPGALLEFDPDGIPYRASIDETSPYYWYDPDVRITVDGKLPSACTGWNRREGYVECDEVEPGGEWASEPGKGFGIPIIPKREVRRYGKIEVTRVRP